MNIHVFASLKEYMPSQFEIDSAMISTVEELKNALQLKYPQASALIAICRFSTEQEIITLDQEIKNYDNIFVIPPSSGG